MKNHGPTNEYFREAVKGLNEIILRDKDLWYSYIFHLPTQLQVVYTVTIFHQQVFNGGLHQYFFNSYGQFAYMTVDNLKLIKAFKAAEILQRALEAVNIRKYGIDEFRERIFNRTLDAISNFDEDLGDTLNSLDDQYYSLEEDWEILLVDYLEVS